MNILIQKKKTKFYKISFNEKDKTDLNPNLISDKDKKPPPDSASIKQEYEQIVNIFSNDNEKLIYSVDIENLQEFIKSSDGFELKTDEEQPNIAVNDQNSDLSFGDTKEHPPNLISSESKKIDQDINLISSESEKIGQDINLISSESEKTDSNSILISSESEKTDQNSNLISSEDEKSLKNLPSENEQNSLNFSSENDKVSDPDSSSENDKCNNVSDNNIDISTGNNSIFQDIFNSEYNQKSITQDKFEKVGDLIAQGNFGEVYKVEDESTKTIYAVKIFYMDYQDYPPIVRKQISEHMSIIQQLNFPSILKVHEFNTSCNFDSENRQAILINYCENGSLAQAIPNKKFNKTKRLINIFGIAAAMYYLHVHDICHYDLKTSTILEDENFYPKLSDIGFSKHFHGLKAMAKVKDFSPYIAPEVLMGEEFTKKSEVYSFGLIFCEIITDKFPLEGEYHSQFELLKLICDGVYKKIPDNIVAFKSLIKDCLSMNPDDRPDFKNICQTLRSESSYSSYLNSDESKEYKKYFNAVDFYISTYNSLNQNIEAVIINVPNDEEKKHKKVKKKVKKKSKKSKKDS